MLSSKDVFIEKSEIQSSININSSEHFSLKESKAVGINLINSSVTNKIEYTEIRGVQHGVYLNHSSIVILKSMIYGGDGWGRDPATGSGIYAVSQSSVYIDYESIVESGHNFRGDMEPFYTDNTSSIVFINNKSQTFELYSNYPNPFNPETTIKYNLPADQSVYQVKIKIYDALGQLITTLINEPQNPGMHTVKCNGKNGIGQTMPSGIYFCVVEAGQFNSTQKMLLVR